MQKIIIDYNYNENTLDIKIVGDYNTFLIPMKNIISATKRYIWAQKRKVWYKKLKASKFNYSDLLDELHEEFLFINEIIESDFLDFSKLKEKVFQLKKKKTTDIELFETQFQTELQKVLRRDLLEKAMFHQIESIKRFYLQNKKLLLAFEMGAGKTVASFLIFATRAHKNSQAIICVTKSLVTQWYDQLLEWNIVKSSEIEIIQPLKKKFKFLNSKSHKIYILNYEMLNFLYNDKRDFSKYTEKEKNLYNWLISVDHQNTLCIFDELYKIKNYRTRNYIAWRRILDSFPFFGIVGLTGTPMENNLMEFYNTLNFIQPGIISWQEMEQNFVYKINSYTNVYRNLDLFNLKATSLMYRIKKSDVRKDLPKLVCKFRFVENTKIAHELIHEIMYDSDNENKRRYKTKLPIYMLMRTFDSYFESHEKLKLYNLLKDVIIEQNNKFNELLDILHEIGNNKILIFTSFSKTAVWLKNKLVEKKYICEYIDSSVSNDKQNNIKENFKNLNNKLQIVISTSVWDRGVDFPDIDYLCNWDFPLNPATYSQRINRIYRINSQNQKIVINLISDIIEKDVYNIIVEKSKNIEKAVEGLSEAEIKKKLEIVWSIKFK